MTTTTRDITATITGEVADALLALAGFERDEYGRWVADRDGEYLCFWLTEEALVHALPMIAERLAV